MVIKFTPYRGKIEPVVDVHKAQITLYEDFLEVVYSYEYEKFDSGKHEIDRCFGAWFFSKYDTNLSRSAMYHHEDPTQELCPYVGLDVQGMPDTIYLRCKSNKEADAIYTKIKTYLLEESGPDADSEIGYRGDESETQD